MSKNGILIVEFANAKQLQGLSKLDAVREAASTRLRPILMTTVATVAGHFPLTLFVVPSVYVLVARDHRREREAGSAARDVPTATTSPAWRHT